MGKIDRYPLQDGGMLIRLKVLEDNYAYLITFQEHALVIDPGEAAPILSVLREQDLTLKHILVTHHHADHVRGVKELRENYPVRLIGPADDRIASLDDPVSEGEELIVTPFLIRVLDTPGHTCPHLSYFFPDQELLFPGDLIFHAGCGRLFEGTKEQMWHSISKILKLPSQTKLLFAHEYGVANLTFALGLEPNNVLLQTQLTEWKSRLEQELSAPLSTLIDEQQINPFLRVGESAFKEQLGFQATTDPIDLFAYIRSLKDRAS